MFKKARYVYAVYKEGSFTKAAQKLFISQPCLSAAIRQLEGQIGAPLFERKNTSIIPTELGFAYIKTAEQILALEDEFAAHVKQQSKEIGGTVRVGGSNYVSSYILPRIVTAFAKNFPNVTISLTEANSADLTRLLQAEELDLVVDSFDTEQSDLTYHVLLREKILLAVPASAPTNHGNTSFALSPTDIYRENERSSPPISITQFCAESFILLKSGNSMYEHAMAIFKKGGFTPKVTLFLDQLSTSFALAAQGNGLCFVTDTVFRYHKFDDPVLLYHIKESGTRALCLAHKKTRHLTPALQKFIDIAQKSIQ